MSDCSYAVELSAEDLRLSASIDIFTSEVKTYHSIFERCGSHKGDKVRGTSCSTFSRFSPHLQLFRKISLLRGRRFVEIVALCNIP